MVRAWAQIFDGEYLNVGEIIDYIAGIPEVKDSPPQGKIYKTFYRATVIGFDDPEHIVIVQQEPGAPTYRVFNGPYRTDILRVIPKPKEQPPSEEQ